MRSPDPRIATLVLCPASGEVLGRLPPFRTEAPWWQDAEGLRRGAQEYYGLEVIVLRLLDAAQPAPPGGAVTYLAEVTGPLPAGLVLEPWHGRLGHHQLRRPYAEPGGPARDLAWTSSVLERHGVAQTAPAEQVRTWNLSSLWRIPTGDSAVWLKCVPPLLAHEGPVLAALQDAPVPRLLGHDDCRVLLAEVPGEDQYDADVDTMLAAVSLLIDLQVSWTGCDENLLALGVPDFRASALTAAIASVVERAAAGLEHQDRRALDALVRGLPQRFGRISACGIPDSLVHGDFAPGNCRAEGDELVLLDWGDSCLGHPFLDQASFVDRIPAECVLPVRRHWQDAWRTAVPGCDPARAVDLLAPVAAARQAAVYQRFLDGIETSEHPYHRDDLTLWLTRAARLAQVGTG